MSDVVSISVAETGYHACALKSDGTVECWGDSYNGVLDIPNGLNAVKQVSA
ncbi:hypothetical protein H6769_02290 [Candidatus Peribacteria bacterium]|nr:hypothetical protein [Candidatus Peribacteria bacterium]